MSFSTSNKLLRFLIESSYQVEDLLNYHDVFSDDEEEFKFKETNELQQPSSYLPTNNLNNCNQAVQFLANATLPQQHQISLTNRFALQQHQQQSVFEPYNYTNNQLQYPSSYVPNGFGPIQHFSQSGYNTSNDHHHQQNNYLSLTSANSTQFSAKLQTPTHYPQNTGFAYLDEPSQQQQQHHNSQISIGSSKQAESIGVPEYKFECAYCYYLAARSSATTTTTTMGNSGVVYKKIEQNRGEF